MKGRQESKDRRGNGNGDACEPDVAAQDNVGSAPGDKGGPQADDDEANGAGEVTETEALQQELAEANDRLLRARADLENYRRRVQREYEQVRYTAKAATVEEFLNVFDHFQMAREHAANDSDVEALRRGMDLIMAEFEKALAGLGVERVNAVGQEFDPTQHEAMAQQPSTDVPAGHVLQQWKSGYRLGERLLRPATVVVSAGPPGGGS